MKTVFWPAVIFPLLLILAACTQKPARGKASLAKTETDLRDASRRAELSDFDTLDRRTVLTRLFDHPVLDSRLMAVWKGNYAELTSLSIPLSFDGNFHTALDTILYFTDNQDRRCAVAIFSTYSIQVDSYDSLKPEIITGCHFCGASVGAALFLSRERSKWELYAFKKEVTTLGYFGTYKTGRQDSGIIKLKEIGDHYTALSITQGPGGNMGIVEGGELLVNIEQFGLNGVENEQLRPILANYYSANETFLARVPPPALRMEKRKGGYYDIVARTIIDDTVKTARYRYSHESGQYMKVH